MPRVDWSNAVVTLTQEKSAPRGLGSALLGTKQGPQDDLLLILTDP